MSADDYADGFKQGSAARVAGREYRLAPLRHVDYVTGYKLGYEAPTACAWFARCTRPATHIAPHRILSHVNQRGDTVPGVPCCDECAANAS